MMHLDAIGSWMQLVPGCNWYLECTKSVPTREIGEHVAGDGKNEDGFLRGSRNLWDGNGEFSTNIPGTKDSFRV